MATASAGSTRSRERAQPGDGRSPLDLVDIGFQAVNTDYLISNAYGGTAHNPGGDAPVPTHGREAPTAEGVLHLGARMTRSRALEQRLTHREALISQREQVDPRDYDIPPQQRRIELFAANQARHHWDVLCLDERDLPRAAIHVEPVPLEPGPLARQDLAYRFDRCVTLGSQSNPLHPTPLGYVIDQVSCRSHL